MLSRCGYGWAIYDPTSFERRDPIRDYMTIGYSFVLTKMGVTRKLAGLSWLLATVDSFGNETGF
jgi:hypothetical protein